MGAGLGLFIAEGLVSAMGGRIRVSSIEGEGSRFVFELPLAGRAEVRDVTRVLVVDDDAPIRLLCRVNLEAEGMEVIEAADGTDGLEKARRRAARRRPARRDAPEARRLAGGGGAARGPDDRRDPDRLPDRARRAPRPGSRPRDRRDRLHHEAFQPGRARRPDPRAARPRPARRADEPCARRSSRACAGWPTGPR